MNLTMPCLKTCKTLPAKRKIKTACLLDSKMPELSLLYTKQNRVFNYLQKIGLACLMCCLPMVGLFAQITVNTPLGGWRSSATANDFAQKTYYPASSVNTEGVSKKAQISGQIAQLPKTSANASAVKSKNNSTPAKLVVNGTEMPLKVTEGRFARPWAFGPGSNSVEVRSAENSRKVQFYEARSEKGSAKLRVILSWDADETDVDLHIVSPDGQHAWYGDQIVANGGGIDVDVTTGYGPEIYSNPVPIKGTYLIFTNYYGGSSQKTVVMATVTVITEEGTGKEKRQIFYVPLRKPGELQLVQSFQY